MSRPPALAPLREQNFRWYFLSRLVNMVGATMASVALAFAVLEVSDSPSALGTVLAAMSIPLVIFLLVGGVVADRFGRTLVIQTSNLVSGLCQLGIAALVLSGHAQVWQLVCLAAVIGTSSAMGFPALASVLPQLVSRDQLQQANVLISMMRGSLTVIGPSVAGILVVTVGPGWALAVDGVSYLGAAALLLRVHIPAPVRREDQPSIMVELREGWTVFRATTWLWVVVLTFSALNAIHAGTIFTLGPVLAKQSDIGERGWGLILSAEAVGLLAMTLVMSRVRLERPLLFGMLGIGALSLPMLMLGLYPQVAAVMAVMVLAGAGTEIFNLGWNLAMQEHIPDDVLSRAYSYDALGSFVAIPVGQLLFGPLGAAFGVQQVILVGGIGYAAIVALALTSRSVRGLQRVSPTSPAAP
ncbi:MFS transporter [Nocardioides sp. cx-169]|uniref:MFS transporter n=1 Tax=Nocardioides sp. cx-169 TaxID=2899080 RepID=UPI001E3F05E4|nr:MFS transporter [Nocardioides sp. cx-169]MCD4533983.1 MFS transporter [Nocardioides sp. cx-169]